MRLVSKTTSYAYELDTDEDHYFVLDEAFAVVEAETAGRPFDERLQLYANEHEMLICFLRHVWFLLSVQEVWRLRQSVYHSRGGGFFDSKELRQCYQLQYDNIRKLPGFLNWKEKLREANPQYILNTYVYLEVCNLPEELKTIMRNIFIRCQKDRTELKRISDHIKKTEMDADP